MECDTVAGHSNAVSVLATVLAYEFSDRLKSETGVELNLPDVTLMATFHDFGEARSGDTGVSSLSVHGVCKLFPLEREGLEANLMGLKISQRILELFDDYRGYRTPEALIVHVADNLEGIEKGFHAARGAKEIIEDVLKNIKANLEIYRNKKEVDELLGTVARFFVQEILIPGIEVIADAYGIEMDMQGMLKGGLLGRNAFRIVFSLRRTYWAFTDSPLIFSGPITTCQFPGHFVVSFP